jgi:hypothetical protein
MLLADFPMHHVRMHQEITQAAAAANTGEPAIYLKLGLNVSEQRYIRAKVQTLVGPLAAGAVPEGASERLAEIEQLFEVSVAEGPKGISITRGDELNLQVDRNCQPPREHLCLLAALTAKMLDGRGAA